MVKLIFDEYTNRKDLTPQQRWFLRNRQKSSQGAMISARKRKLSKPEEYLLYTVRGSAKQRGILFNLSLADISIPAICPILGIELKYPEIGHSNGTPSLDRVDNDKGYTKDNVRVISQRANTLKNNMTIEQVKSLLKYMENNGQSQETPV